MKTTLMNDPYQFSLTCVRLCCFFDITYIFLNEKCYLTSQRVMKLTVYYTRVNVFSIYLLLFVYRCVLFFKTSPIFGRVSARSGIVSLFTCVTTIFLSKHKTNLVPSFLPALSSSTCIISLANQYNTSVDAAIVQRQESDFQVKCLKVTVVLKGVVIISWVLLYSWLAGKPMTCSS